MEELKKTKSKERIRLNQKLLNERSDIIRKTSTKLITKFKQSAKKIIITNNTHKSNTELKKIFSHKTSVNKQKTNKKAKNNKVNVIPAKKILNVVLPDTKFLDDIHVEILNEISTDKAAIKIQKAFRQHLRSKKITVETQTSPCVFEAQKNIDTSLSEVRLLIGSEKRLKEKVVQEIVSPVQQSISFSNNEIDEELDLLMHSNHNRSGSIFSRTPFDDFTQTKLKQLLKADNVSSLIGMREKVLKYKETTEMKYITTMYKANKFSSRTYQRKREELEKWVSKEKEEIKKTKTNLIETWKRTATIIEEAHNNAMQLKSLLMTHTLSYNSESRSNLSMLDSHRAITDRILHPTSTKAIYRVPDSEQIHSPSLANLDNIFSSTISFKKKLNERLLSPYNKDINEDGNIQNPNEAILIQEETLSEAKKPCVDKDIKGEESKGDGDVVNIEEIQLDIKLDHSETKLPNNKDTEAFDNDKERVIDSTIELIYEKLIEETFTNPIILSAISKLNEPTEQSVNRKFNNPKAIEVLNQSPQKIVQRLAIPTQETITVDEEYISNYVETILTHMLNTKEQEFIAEINKALINPPLSILEDIQLNQIKDKPLSHEVSPILPLQLYNDQGTSIKNTYISIHNKAIFNSINEALNLIRPYGLNGEPMIWNSQSRLLFKELKDHNIIVRNVKNMVLDWASFEAGTLPKSEFIVEGKFDEEYFTEVREKQLGTLLAQEVIIKNKRIDDRW